MQSLSVTLIQTDIAWQNKEANLSMLAQKIKNRAAPTELVILPEMFSTGFSMQPLLLAETMDGHTIQWMKEIATSEKIILTGSIIIKEQNNFYNRLIWMLPNGELGYYDKRHLFSFAGENEHYTAGKKRLIAQVNGWKINLQICYDLRFAVWGRQATTAHKVAEYDVLIYVANWPAVRCHAWQTLLCARAIENQCYVIGVNRVGSDGNHINYNGHSMIIDPLGQIIAELPDGEAMYTTTLQKTYLEEVRAKYPFLKDADEYRLI